MFKLLMLVCSVQLASPACAAGDALDVISSPDSSHRIACASPSRARSADLALAGPTGLSGGRTIELGSHGSAADLLEALRAGGCKLGDKAEEVLARGPFIISRARADVELAVLSVAQLGFGAEGAPPAKLYARAAQLGLELCPPEIGPQLRLQYPDQPIGEYLHIAMAPLDTGNGSSVVFIVGNGGAGLVLLGAEPSPGFIAPASRRYVFIRPHRAADTVMRTNQHHP